MTNRSDRFGQFWSRPNLGVVGLFVAAFALGLYKLAAQLSVGPEWDTYSFMANAAAIAGRGYGYTEPARPPLISVISAPIVALGFMNPAVIQVVDFTFLLLALAGVYVIARRRVGRVIAAGAALAVLMAPPLWDWVGVGYTDIAAVALCIWALIAVIKATEENPRFYAAAFSLIVCAALMRTTSLLFIMPFGVWMLLRSRFFPHARQILLGLLAAICVYLPFGVFYAVTLGEPFYPIVTSLRIQQSASLGIGVAREVASYFTGLPVLAAPAPIAALTVLALLLAAWGLVWGAAASLRVRHVASVRIVAAAVLAALCALAASKGGLLSSQLAIAGGVYFVWRLVASEEQDAEGGMHRVVPADRALDATVIAWLLSYYVFHESWAQRVTRYYIPMAPQVAILVAIGWNELVRRVPAQSIARQDGWTLSDWTSDPLPLLRRLVWIPLAVLLVAGFAYDVRHTSWTPDTTVVEATKTAAYLSTRPDLQTSTVYSDIWPATAWYLRRDVAPMPLFDDSAAVGHELQKNSADYFVTTHLLTPASYRPVYATGQTRVLAGSGRAEKLPRVLYLGSGWENYLERLNGYRIDVVHDEGDYNIEGTALYDSYPLTRVKKFGAVVAFGGAWRGRASAERLLLDYAAQGGTLVLDASGNLNEPFSFGNSVLFDTVIQRALVPADSSIVVDPAFAAAHSSIGTITPSPWMTDTNDPWYGAGYDALPGSAPLKVIARIGGRPLIAERAWGRGRVIWMAYNLPWHAFLTKNAGEARLIQAVLSEAIQDQP